MTSLQVQNRRRLGVYPYLLRYGAPYGSTWMVLLLATLLTAGVALLQPWPLQFLIDYGVRGRPLPQWLWRDVHWVWGASSRIGIIAWGAGAGVVIYLISSVLETVLTFAWIRTGQAMAYDLGGDLFNQLQRQSLRYHSVHPVGDSMSRVTGDSWCVHDIPDQLIFTPLQTLIYIAGAAVVMARMNLRLTLIAVLAAPLMGIGIYTLKRRIRKLARARREIDSRIQSHLQQTLSGIQVVQAFGQEEREQEQFRAYTDEALAMQRRNALLTSLGGLWTGLITTAGTGLILLLGSYEVLHGKLTLGGLLVFVSYLNALNSRFTILAGTYTNLQNAGAQADRAIEVLDSIPEVAELPDARSLSSLGPVRGKVTLENVTFGYEAERPVLSDVSLEIPPGQTIALVGPTGAGKSTIAGLVPRFFDPWSGRLLLDGRDLKTLRLTELRKNVSLVLQEPLLFPRTIAENIGYGRPGATRSEIEAAARAANAAEFIERLPQGYDTILGERGATLSGGQRQRLGIARALLRDAPVLILDEPTSALDAGTESLLLSALDRLTAGKTCLIIAHRLSTIRRADLIVVLDRGKIVERGRHDELVAANGLYAGMHRSQAGMKSEPPMVAVAER